MITTAAPKRTPRRERLELKHRDAARCLISEVAKAVEGTTTFLSVFGQWNQGFAAFRVFEKEWVIRRQETPAKKEFHRKLVNLLMLAAASLIAAAEREMEVNDRIKQEVLESLESCLELVRQHRKILAFEYKGCTPASCHSRNWS